jgi:hypothetical protein
MRKLLPLLLGILSPFVLWAQKKPLDHSVYDGWKSAGERSISNDGKYVVYAVNPQEGDGVLVKKKSRADILPVFQKIAGISFLRYDRSSKTPAMRV